MGVAMNHDDTPLSSFKHEDTPFPFCLTPAELAARWKVTTMTLRRWRKGGRLKASYIGRQIRFTMDEVLRFEREAEA